MAEGFQKIYNALTGNVDASTLNMTRDVFFGGDQEVYDKAETILGVSNFVGGLGVTYLPFFTPSSGGKIIEYANAGSQVVDFLESVEEAVEGNSNPNSERLALGLSDYLDDFADLTDAHTWKDFNDVTNWQQGILDELHDPNIEVVFNLDGIDSVWSAVTRAASGRGGATDWELFQIYNNPEFWNKIIWYQNGAIVPNPFE